MQRGFIMTFAASVKSARERAKGSWILENADGDRNSLGLCAVAMSLPKTSSNDAQPDATSEIIVERSPRLSQPRLFA
jgi:hypothetical protein